MGQENESDALSIGIEQQNQKYCACNTHLNDQLWNVLFLGHKIDENR